LLNSIFTARDEPFRLRTPGSDFKLLEVISISWKWFQSPGSDFKLLEVISNSADTKLNSEYKIQFTATFFFCHVQWRRKHIMTVPARCRVKVALRHTYVSCACAMPHPLWT